MIYADIMHISCIYHAYIMQVADRLAQESVYVTFNAFLNPTAPIFQYPYAGGITVEPSFLGKSSCWVMFGTSYHIPLSNKMVDHHSGSRVTSCLRWKIASF